MADELRLRSAAVTRYGYYVMRNTPRQPALQTSCVRRRQLAVLLYSRDVSRDRRYADPKQLPDLPLREPRIAIRYEHAVE